MHPEDRIEGCGRDLRHRAIGVVDDAADGEMDVVVRPLFEQSDLGAVAVQRVAAETRRANSVEEGGGGGGFRRLADRGADLQQAAREGDFAIGMEERIWLGPGAIDELRRVDRGKHATLFAGIIPVGQRQHGIAGHQAQMALEEMQIGAMPQRELGRRLAEMRALVPIPLGIDGLELGIAPGFRVEQRIAIGVHRGPEEPASVVRARQRLHRRDALAQRSDADGIGREGGERLTDRARRLGRAARAQRQSPDGSRRGDELASCLAHAHPRNHGSKIVGDRHRRRSAATGDSSTIVSFRTRNF